MITCTCRDYKRHLWLTTSWHLGQLVLQTDAKHGYYELHHSSDLWHNLTHPVQFTLVTDDFGIIYVRLQNSEHLLAALS